MGAWYECGNGMVQSKMARCSSPSTYFLCCPGPSLAKAPQSLQGPGRTVVDVNTAYPRIRPDMWVGMDLPTCFDRNLPLERFPKFWRCGYQDIVVEGKKLRTYDGSYFIDLGEGGIDTIFARRDHDANFVWQSHTLGVALHLLIWLGAKDIVFVGCDMGGDRDYYDGRVLRDELKKSNKKLYTSQVKWLKIFSFVAEMNNIKLRSATPDSPINEFMKYQPLPEILEETPTLESSEPLHCRDANAIIRQDYEDNQITVACVLKSGGDFTPEYVDRLKKGVDANLSNYEFVCLTDVPEQISGCRTIRFRYDWPGWWSRIELFEVFRNKRVLYLDLDTVVKGSLEWAKGLSDGFYMMEDLGEEGKATAAVMLWTGDKSRIIDTYIANKDKYPYNSRSDYFFRDTVSEYVKILPKELTASYKWGTTENKKKACLLCYHGKPRPHEVGWAIFRDDESP